MPGSLLGGDAGVRGGATTVPATGARSVSRARSSSRRSNCAASDSACRSNPARPAEAVGSSNRRAISRSRRTRITANRPRSSANCRSSSRSFSSTTGSPAATRVPGGTAETIVPPVTANTRTAPAGRRAAGASTVSGSGRNPTTPTSPANASAAAVTRLGRIGGRAGASSPSFAPRQPAARSNPPRITANNGVPTNPIAAATAITSASGRRPSGVRIVNSSHAIAIVRNTRYTAAAAPYPSSQRRRAGSSPSSDSAGAAGAPPGGDGEAGGVGKASTWRANRPGPRCPRNQRPIASRQVALEVSARFGISNKSASTKYPS
ncbi:hypothetical protein LzC2_38710 [Planctomycetes bacterium LzC2]|uniref:Uncharacterized protein n=1 Tax=Alienimonas chondri TaxID=2681879 RepID=A0ABX1VI25_9PLAN|nr:hypothetical protein [Alienimonas chondri]